MPCKDIDDCISVKHLYFIGNYNSDTVFFYNNKQETKKIISQHLFEPVGLDTSIYSKCFYLRINSDTIFKLSTCNTSDTIFVIERTMLINNIKIGYTVTKMKKFISSFQ